MGACIKDEARQIVEELPGNSTWDNLMYRIYVRQTSESGLNDSEKGRTTNVGGVRAKFGLPR